jgi:hypothetical protein
MKLSTSPRGVSKLAAVVGGGIGLALVTGVGPAPSLLSAAASDDSTGGSTTTTTSLMSTTETPSPSGGQVVEGAGAGTVTFTRSSAGLSLVSAVPASGWRVEVEQAAGDEIEVDFRQGSRRVQVNLELEDGAVRERVRIRDQADGSEIRLENGTVVRTEAGNRVDDDRRGDDHDDDDNSGPGSGRDDDHHDDGDNSSGRGPGSSGGHDGDDD